MRPDISNAVHEIAHDIEWRNPSILKKSKNFLKSRRRTINGNPETPQKLSILTGNPEYKDDEKAIEDEWKTKGGTPYSGRVYHDKDDIDQVFGTEIITIGVERIFNNPYVFAQNDPDYFNFVVKTLRTQVMNPPATVTNAPSEELRWPDNLPTPCAIPTAEIIYEFKGKRRTFRGTHDRETDEAWFEYLNSLRTEPARQPATYTPGGLINDMPMHILIIKLIGGKIIGVKSPWPDGSASYFDFPESPTIH